jgi:hypothetical protein
MQTYEDDVVAWANEQARLLRAGRFDLLDIQHIAEEIEDVGKSEQRELATRADVGGRCDAEASPGCGGPLRSRRRLKPRPPVGKATRKQPA